MQGSRATSKTAAMVAAPRFGIAVGSKDELRPIQLISYGIGHHMNDLCAACWFTYLLIFLESPAVGESQMQAGLIMLSGQVADGFTTPLIGLVSDATPDSLHMPALGLGKRKLWHALGSVIVCFSFSATFGGLLPEPGVLRTLYLAAGASLFNVGWAAVQVSHMSLLPELHADEGERTRLQSTVYASTVTANLLMFTLFGICSGIDAARPFGLITLGVMGIGGCTTLWFHANVRERCDRGCAAVGVAAEAEKAAAWEAAEAEPSFSPWRWFCLLEFYLCGATYMLTRIVVNMSQTYVPFFVINTLRLPHSALATVPAAMYVSALMGTSVQARVTSHCGKPATYLLGALCVGAAAASLAFVPPLPSAAAYLVYPAASLLGCGGTMALVTSVTMEADLVDRHPSSAAFLYGVMSLTDKLANGSIIFLIQAHRELLMAGPGCAGLDLSHQRDCALMAAFTRQVVVLGCGLTAVVGCLAAFLTHVVHRATAAGNDSKREPLLGAEYPGASLPGVEPPPPDTPPPFGSAPAQRSGSRLLEGDVSPRSKSTPMSIDIGARLSISPGSWRKRQCAPASGAANSASPLQPLGEAAQDSAALSVRLSPSKQPKPSPLVARDGPSSGKPMSKGRSLRRGGARSADSPASLDGRDTPGRDMLDGRDTPGP